MFLLVRHLLLEAMHWFLLKRLLIAKRREECSNLQDAVPAAAQSVKGIAFKCALGKTRKRTQKANTTFQQLVQLD